ncbi:MAG: VWA domain-containing protein, partial [Clostridia bacterium]|nr:VWA domain-containing protein [Clostridia bacterium]
MEYQESKRKLNLLILVASFVVSAVCWIPIYMLYEFLLGVTVRVVAVAAAFTLLMTVSAIVIFLLSLLSSTFNADVVRGKTYGTRIPLYIIAGMCLCMLLGMGLEFIYELGFQTKIKETEGYIFVVDDSGSMSTSDPAQKRFNAIESLLSEQEADFPYMIYMFDDSASLVQQMTTVGNGIPALSGDDSGGTAIRGALLRVIEDYRNGMWSGEKLPKVILLTDGYPTDIGVFQRVDQVIRAYNKEGIPISTIGFDAADNTLLTNIAEATGGVFVDSVDADKLEEAMKTAAVKTADDTRTLLSQRVNGGLGWISGVLRVVFVTILGALMTLLFMVCYGRTEEDEFIMVCGVVKAFLAALILEIGICVLMLPSAIVCWISMTMLGTLIAQYRTT